MKRVAALLVLSLWSAAGGAVAVEFETLKETPLAWQTVRGTAKDVAVNGAGQVFAVGLDNVVWRWRNAEARWSKISGKLVRIAVGPKGRAWGIGEDSRVYRRNGLWWDELDETARDLSVAADGTVVRADPDGALFARGKFGNRWKPVFGRKAVRVAATGKGSLWIIQNDGTIARFDGRLWHDIPGTAVDIAAGPDGDIFIAALDGTVQSWSPAASEWTILAGTSEARSLAVGPENKPWYVRQNGEMRAASLFQPEGGKDDEAEVTRRPSDLSPAEITDTSPIVFTQVRGLAQHLAIGADGSVFAIDAEGGLQRWNNAQRKFRTFPGSLKRVAVDPAGNPWGVNSRRQIFRHTGRDWTQVKGSAVDIDIAVDGSVVIADQGEKLFRLDRAANRFIRIPGRGDRIALHPNGEVWTIRKDGRLFRCTADACTRLKRTGADIATGPDGSVFLADKNKKLFRFDTKRNDWVRVETSRSAVALAVGPKGRPWIADTNKSVYASAFFERDESDDAKTAATTRQPTVATAAASAAAQPSIFTFKKNLKYEEFDASTNGADDIKVGVDGSVWLLGCTGTNLKLFNEKNETFEIVDFTLPGSGTPFTVSSDADGRLWMADSTSGAIHHQKKKDGNSFDSYTIASSGAGTAFVAVGGDGSVFAVGKDYALYRYNESKDKFEEFDDDNSYSKVAVMPDGTPWVVTSGNTVLAWTGKKFDDPGKNTLSTVGDIAIGAGGTVFITESSQSILMKWNTTNKEFDETNTTATGSTHVAVDPAGRPWYSPGTCNDTAFRAK